MTVPTSEVSDSRSASALDPSDTRPSGSPPYWAPGTPIWWRYRHPSWTPDDPQMVTPVRVIRDDADGLVVWLAPDTPVLRAVLPDGRNGRSAGLHGMFRTPRVQGLGSWDGSGIIQIKPTGVPWSVWVFWTVDRTGWTLRKWYVNIEEPHLRDDRNVYTSDHVLDLEVFPDRSIHWKDEDELDAAVAAGRYTAEEAERIVEDGRAAAKVVTAWESPFCDGWEDWRPDPSWPMPELPTDVVAVIREVPGA